LRESFARLDCSGSMLVIVESSPEETRLKALAAQLCFAESCHFEPATSQVAEFFSRVDIFVLPSRTEVLSNSLTEAMACECWVVASREWRQSGVGW